MTKWMERTGMTAVLIGAALLLLACGEDGSGGTDGDLQPGDLDEETLAEEENGDAQADGDGLEEEAETAGPFAVTTAAATLVPTVPTDGSNCATDEQQKMSICKNPATAVPDIQAYLDADMGTWTTGPGEPYTRNESLGVTLGTPGERRAIFRFAHLTDIHITDEEGPMRMAKFDNKTIDSALRPCDMYTEVTLDAAIRTINSLGEGDPLDFVLFTGDVSDTSETFEIRNFIGVVNGGEVNPDSGEDDDPAAGPGNDPQDLFTAEGLKDSPWLILLGNHDELILGNAPITDDAKADSVGSKANAGTRDGETYEVIGGTIVADENRVLLDHAEMIAAFAAAPGHPAGHGFTSEMAEANRAYYAYDVPTAPVRVIVLDSTFRPLGFEGQSVSYVDPVMPREEFDDFLLPELDRALTDKKFVVISTHGPSNRFQDDNIPERFVTTEEFVSTVAGYPNVLLHCVGHEHYSRVWAHPNPTNDGGYFEVESPALADWPKQFRQYELVDNGNGTLSIFVVNVDYAAEPGSLADMSRLLTLLDPQTGWYVWGETDIAQRNVELVLPVPDGFEEVLSGATAKPSVAALNRWMQTEP